MPDTTLRSLVDRLETEEPSRELDAEIGAALKILPPHPPDWLGKKGGFAAFPGGTIREDFGGGKFGFTWVAPRLTSSIDAKLPGEDDGYWLIEGPLPNGRWTERLHPRPAEPGHFDGEAATEAMARRAAYLKSRQRAYELCVRLWHMSDRRSETHREKEGRRPTAPPKVR